jgi:hypothetical protein
MREQMAENDRLKAEIVGLGGVVPDYKRKTGK